MSAHSGCRHVATPSARRTCREMRAVAELAEKWGLVVRDTSDDMVAQLSFVEPEDRWYSMRVLWTRCYSQGGYRFKVMFASGGDREDRGKPGLISWLKTLSRRP